MRRIDKKINIIKANILTEQRYLENKMGVCENDMCEEDIVEETTDESLKRDTSNSTTSSSEPNKNVVGSDNINAIKKVASDPYKVKKALDSQHSYTEGEE